MKKKFALLTRSYKYGGYCIAGADLETKRWIRFVSSTDAAGNEIPKYFFESFDDLDILEVEVRGEAKCGCQTENFLLDLSQKPVRRGRLSFYELLSPVYLSAAPSILGGDLSYLEQGEIGGMDHSFGLYKVDALQFDYYLGDDGKMHYRCGFLYAGKSYAGLSVTDPVYRKDEFAGQTVDHALLAVSLPAIPYYNGNYYKFVAKIFPLSEAEARHADELRAGAQKPTSFLYSRDLPAAEDISRARNFLGALAAGRDPDTDRPLEPQKLLSPSYAAWFSYCASLLGGKGANAARRQIEQIEQIDKKCTYLLRGRIVEIGTSDDAVTASVLKDRVNAVREPYGKALTAHAVGLFFLEAGLVSEGENNRKMPTARGREYAIAADERRTVDGIPYTVLLYGKAAQQFFIDNIGQCVEVIEHPLPLNVLEEKRGRSWSAWEREEDENLRAEFASGRPLYEIARKHKRSVRAVVARLRRLGITVEV